MHYLSPRWVSLTVAIMLAFTATSWYLTSADQNRQRYRRMATLNNLKQCAIAMHLFADVYRRFPDAYGPLPNSPDRIRSMWVAILPYVEAETVSEKDASDAIVNAYLALNDLSPDDKRGRLGFAGNIRLFGHQTLGPETANAVQSAITVPDGILKSMLAPHRIRDGASKVLMLTTRFMECSGVGTYYAGNPLGTNLPPQQQPGVGGFMGAGAAATPASPQGLATDAFQIPARNPCVPDAALFGHALHPYGLTIALADASGMTLSPTISPRVFACLLSPGDGEALPNGWDE